MPESRFPNLFIIGAMKSGTSSLHEYLHQHPSIFMSRMKEPQYFAPHRTRWGQDWGQGNLFPEPGIEWYLRLFKDAGNVRYAGESSVSYTAAPWVEKCEDRIYEFNPDAKCIYLMRDPLERAISHYWHFVVDGREDLDMLSAFRSRSEYIARSDYAMQLKPYLNRFGKENVLAITSEQLNTKPLETFRSLFSWLDIDSRFEIDTTQRFNVGTGEVLHTRRGCVFIDTFLKSWRWKQWEKRVPSPITNLVWRISHRRVHKASIDARPGIDFLRPILQIQVEELAKILGREFSEWTTLFPD